MIGISNLQTVFGGGPKVQDDLDAVSSPAAGKNSAVAAGNQPLTGMDQTVVSSAGDAMLQAMGSSDVRTDKVASLQAAIANGTYNVSSSDVAGKMISSMLGQG
jgi:negative regulator of flagellin synthesis FlgM